MHSPDLFTKESGSPNFFVIQWPAMTALALQQALKTKWKSVSCLVLKSVKHFIFSCLENILKEFIMQGYSYQL